MGISLDDRERALVRSTSLLHVDKLPLPDQKPGPPRAGDLSEAEARALIDEIKRDSDDLLDKILKAKRGRAWIGLGYANWPALALAEFGKGRSQGYAMVEWAMIRQQVLADSKTSEFSDWIRTMRPSWIAALKGTELVLRDRVLQAAFQEHRKGKRITAERMTELRRLEEEKRDRPIQRHQTGYQAARSHFVGGLAPFARWVGESGWPDDLTFLLPDSPQYVSVNTLVASNRKETDEEMIARLDQTALGLMIVAEQAPLLAALIRERALKLTSEAGVPA